MSVVCPVYTQHQTFPDPVSTSHLAKALHADPLLRIRGHHTRRSMLEEEFEAIWESQRKHEVAMHARDRDGSFS